MPRISPGSHSTVTSNGRQQTSQSVVKRWNGAVVSTTISVCCPQNGHRTVSEISTTKVTRSAPGCNGLTLASTFFIRQATDAAGLAELRSD